MIGARWTHEPSRGRSRSQATQRLMLFAAVSLAAGGCSGISMEPPPDGGLRDAEPAIDAHALEDDGGAPDDAGGPDGGRACAAGEILCGTDCARLDDDPRHCGTCETDCDALPGVAPGLASCVVGACTIDACEAGRADCNGSAADGCEADLSSASSCGACGAACIDGVEVCSASTPGTYACATSCGGATPDRCADACVDLQSDVDHCGACGGACPGAAFGAPVCDGGTCELACDEGYHRCGDTCAPSDSVATCGASCAPCPVPDGAAASCDGAACGFECLAGRADCDGEAANGCEVDLASPESCGACDRDCTALPGVAPGAVACVAGACDVSGACLPGRADCSGGALDGCESDLGSAASCGACAVTCDAATETCEPSGDGYACTNGCDASAPTRCGDACAELSSDPAHCGACGASCSAPAGGSPLCASGACDFACDAGRHRCGDTCALDDSPASCGASCVPCAVPANAAPTCDGGACGFECLPGFADCDGDAANGCELSLSDPAGSTVFCDGFEAGLGAWTVGANWQTTMAPYAGAYSLRGYWGGSPSTGCGITRSTYLASDLDLTSATAVTLEYRHRAELGANDDLYVLVSTDGGASWTTVDAPRGASAWTHRTVDLSAHAGAPALRIGFRFSNICGDPTGVTWRIDDVAVHVTR